MFVQVIDLVAHPFVDQVGPILFERFMQEAYGTVRQFQIVVRAEIGDDVPVQVIPGRAVQIVAPGNRSFRRTE